VSERLGQYTHHCFQTCHTRIEKLLIPLFLSVDGLPIGIESWGRLACIDVTADSSTVLTEADKINIGVVGSMVPFRKIGQASTYRVLDGEEPGALCHIFP
jgi:hypothetical protein